MKPNPCIVMLSLLAVLSFGLSGCRGNDYQDTLVASVANPSHTYRATILLRQGVTDGSVDTTPTTYVLVDKDTGKPRYSSHVEFKDSQIAMKATQCGALQVRWTNDLALTVTCQNCGLALSAATQHAAGVGAIRVEYEGFPERSSWEPGPGPN